MDSACTMRSRPSRRRGRPDLPGLDAVETEKATGDARREGRGPTPRGVSRPFPPAADVMAPPVTEAVGAEHNIA